MAAFRPMDDYRDRQPRAAGTSAPRPTPPRPTTTSTASSPTRASSATSSGSTVPRLGDISGLRGVHLQCHIGTDTLSLARLGAQMTGLDFSGAALVEARALSAEPPAPHVDFVESDVYAAPRRAGTGRLRPGLHRDRRPVLAARHPSLGRSRRRAAPAGRSAVHPRGPPHAAGRSGSARDDGLLVVEYPYFEREEPHRLGPRAAPTSRPTSTSRTTRRTSGTMGSARS